MEASRALRQSVVPKILFFLALAVGLQSRATSAIICKTLYTNESPIQSQAQASLLDQAKARLRKLGFAISSKFSFTMMKLQTIQEAKEGQVLPEGFIKAIESNGGKAVIAFDDASANRFVVVYRVITLKPSDRFDPNMNYADGATPHAAYRKWDGDFVTENLDWTWAYGAGNGHDILIKYLIPAQFLAIDESMSKQEPYYIISKTKLKNANIGDIEPFIAGIARVQQYKFATYDEIFRRTELTEERPQNESDSKLRWMNDQELSKFLISRLRITDTILGEPAE